jgi:hypothetical protein
MNDRADVGVPQGRGGTGLALQALQGVRVVREHFGQELQRHVPPELQVLGPVDDAHTSAAELLENAVVGERLADHEGSIKNREDSTRRAAESGVPAGS